MAYCEPDDVKRVLSGGGTDEEGRTAADLSVEQINIEILNSQAQIDGVLNGSYKVPFRTPPQLIKSICIDIAAYLCDLNYRESREYESDNYPIIRRYNRAREMLEWLRTGVMKVEDVDKDENTSASKVFHQYPPEVLFSLDEQFSSRYRDW